MFERNAQKNELAIGDENCIATKKRWVRNAAEWNPGFSTKIKTCRAVGRLKKRWEDEVNYFFKPETEATNGSDVKNNHTWIQVAKQGDKWKENEDDFAAASRKEKLTFNE